MIKIDVYNCSDFSLESYDRLIQLLSPQERLYVGRFKNYNDRAHRLVARIMLRRAFVASGQQLDAFSIQSGANGKPEITNWNAFNISHSGDLVVVIYSENNVTVGVDIEKITEQSLDEVIDFFHSEERNYIRASTDPIKTFYNVWCKKEAVLKAIGIGIVKGLDEFSVLSDQIDINTETYHLHQIFIDNNYASWIATSKRLDSNIQITNISEEQLVRFTALQLIPVE